MKARDIKYLLSVVLVSIAGFAGSAQDRENGLYNTRADFEANTVSDRQLTDDQNNVRAYRGALKVKRKGVATKYRFGTVFGFYQNGVKYRAYRKPGLFPKNGYYTIIKEGDLTIYACRATHHRSNGSTWYYYSMGTDGEIRRLTKRNLAKDFSNQPEFLSAARAQLEKAEPSEWLVISDLYANFNKPR